MLLVVASCGGGSSAQEGSSAQPGSIASRPGGTGLKYIVDLNKSGQATKIQLKSVEWGRLVDVKDFDSLTNTSNYVFQDLVVRDSVLTQGDYQVAIEPTTGKETLTILHPFGSTAFAAALDSALNLQSVLSKSLDPNELPPFTALPRNAAMLLTFDDLLDASKVSDETIELSTGYPPIVPFNARILPDLNHGDVLDGAFHTTRAIVDLTISKAEADASNPPLVPNTLGLPEATVTTQPNVVLRLPTKANAAFGQFEVLTNLSGHPLNFTGNGPNEPTSPTLDVLRAMRSMGKTAVTGDPNNGFLPDDIPPQIIGRQSVTVVITDDPNSTSIYDFVVDMTFNSIACAQQVRIGDELNVNSVEAVCTAVSTPAVGGVVSDVLFSVKSTENPFQFSGAQGQFTTTWDAAAGVSPACFIRFNPAPGIPPAGDVSVNSTATVEFTEPMDPASVLAFDTFTVTRPPAVGLSALKRYVVGSVVPSIDLKTYTFAPSLPLSHTQGTSETFNFEVVGGPSGVFDLAGNALAQAMDDFSFTVLASEPTQATDGFVLRFSAVDEDVPVINNQQLTFSTPEVRAGQILYDIGRGLVRPRPVSRFSAVADTLGPPTVSIMNVFTAPIQTPLSNKGSRMMYVWRYHDMGFSLTDEQSMNIDVEGLNWAPFGGGVQSDIFPQFRMALTHSAWLPDEVTNPQTALPIYPNSGVVASFDSNVADASKDPLTIVHGKDEGYTINPADSFFSATDTLLHPWPLNRNKLPKDFVYYTFRDTAVQTLAAKFGTGADTERLLQITGVGQKSLFPKGQVPTIGLPLLLEFRCYPNSTAIALNGFKLAFAINSSAAPFFRAFSTGGVSAGGTDVIVDPDNEPTAQGGINPATGGSTPPLDNSFYYGQADFVVRISRMHSIWFDTLLGSPTYLTPIVEPIASAQPAGTHVVLAYRGASSISPAPTSANRATFVNADNLTFYGESITGTPAFTPTFSPSSTSNAWSSTLTSLSGSRFFQFRASFISNADTGLSPELSALGFPYFN